MITVHVCKECGCGFFEHPRRGMCHPCYEAKRQAGNVPGLVDASHARDHIMKLVDAGWNYNQIARAAGIDRSGIAFIVNGRERINADTAFRICAVDLDSRARFVKRIDPAVASARGRKIAATLGPEGCAARARKAAATMGPEARSERQRKREAAMTPEAKSERARKIQASMTPEVREERNRKISEGQRKAWEKRRREKRGAKAAVAEAEAAAQRERFEQARRRAEQQKLNECNVCGKRTVWHRRGMCGECYEKRRNAGGLEWLAVALAPPGAWIEDALCAQIDPDLWFPEKGGSTKDAKKVCLSCTVREQCLEIALENEERFGIWGGKSERERRRLIQEREQPAAAHAKEPA